MAPNPAMTEETLVSTSVQSPAVHREILEVNFAIKTGDWRTSIRLDNSSRATTLKTIFSSIVVTKIECELRQDTFCGTEVGELRPQGHIYVALIPTGKNTPVATGTNLGTVTSVPNKQSFPLSSDVQASRTYQFDLNGYELDLAQDPRRNQGLVLWIGNSGVIAYGTPPNPLQICSSTWRVWVECTGNSVLW